MRALHAILLLLVTAPAVAAQLEVVVRGIRGDTEHTVVWATRDGAAAQTRATAVMDQQNRVFIPHVLPVQQGTAVSFPNSDDIHHQVYSFSEPKRFQLPLYKGTPGKSILFDRTGVVSLGCNIHDGMSAYIIVVDTPHFSLAKEGRVRFADLAPGRYVIRFWHPDLRNPVPPRTITLSASETQTVTLDASRP